MEGGSTGEKNKDQLLSAHNNYSRVKELTEITDDLTTKAQANTA